ncbi:MAG: M50 family metallopeptidase [Bradymonadia bacterium]
MFKASWTIGHLKGIPLRLHASLLLIVPLMAVAFATQGVSYAAHILGLEVADLVLPRPVWGLLLPLVVFFSVLLHELGHALAALALGGKVRHITLMLLGGITQLEHDNATPMQQAKVAFAGPLVSILLGALGLLGLRVTFGLPALQMAALLVFVANGALALFNLLPAFPMDGGRILKALLETRLGPVEATRAAATVGRALAVIGAVFAVFPPFDPSLLLIAGFVFLGATAEEAAAVRQSRLTGLRADQALLTRVATVEPHRAATAVARHMLLQGATVALVRDLEGIRGVLLPQDLQSGTGGNRKVGDMLPSKPLIVDSDADLAQVELQMVRGGHSGAVVINEMNNIIGVVTRGELTRASMLKHVADSSLPPAGPLGESIIDGQ